MYSLHANNDTVIHMAQLPNRLHIIFIAKISSLIDNKLNIFSLRHNVNGDFCDYSSFFALVPETDHICQLESCQI